MSEFGSLIGFGGFVVIEILRSRKLVVSNGCKSVEVTLKYIWG